MPLEIVIYLVLVNDMKVINLQVPNFSLLQPTMFFSTAFDNFITVKL